MGPCLPLVLLHRSSILCPLANTNPLLAPRTFLLASIAGAKLKVSFKGPFLEQWVMVGLEGRRMKGERLEIAIDLAPELLTRESPLLRFELIVSELLTTPKQPKCLSVRGLLRADGGPASRSCSSLQSPSVACRAGLMASHWTQGWCVNFFHLPRGGFQKFSKGRFSCGLNSGPWHHSREEPHLLWHLGTSYFIPGS